MSNVVSDIRRAILFSEVPAGRIAQATGIDRGHLSRFLSGTAGLSLRRLERLAEFLELEIIVRPRRTGNGVK